MKIEEWKSKPEAEQDAQCQQLNPYEEWDLFKAVESEFNALHGNQPGIEKVHVDSALVWGQSTALLWASGGGRSEHLFRNALWDFRC